MLFGSLFLSTIFLILALLISSNTDNSVAILLIIGIGLFGLPIFIGFISPPVIIQVILVCWAISFCDERWLGPRYKIPSAIFATCLAYGAAFLFVLPSQIYYSHFREKFPYESMEDRVPAPEALWKVKSLSAESDSQLTELEERLENESIHYSRIEQLKLLHKDKVVLFASSPGFGVARLRFSLPEEKNIAAKVRDKAPVKQPIKPWYPLQANGEAFRDPSPLEKDAFSWAHLSQTIDFANAGGFGYIKDRQHVAGFQSHEFGLEPWIEKGWQILRLELVSLLLHEEPAVYVSENLPKMDEARQLPTRPLDRFEEAALKELRRGKDIIVETPADGIRMLGALRNAKQCMKCHGGDRGDLLGAFSYTLQAGEK